MAMDTEYKFNTAEGETVARELMIAYLNTGEPAEPEWSALGKRVEDSSMEYDWDEQSKTDILGDTYTNLKKPKITQSFDPCELDSSVTALSKIWNLAVRKQDYRALANQDILIAHFYADADGKNFAERYSSCAVKASSLGGEGGGNMGMPLEITYGGTRTMGTVAKGPDGKVTFTADAGDP